MVKRTLHFSNPAHLSVKNNQLVVEMKDENRTQHTVPIMDLGMVVLEHPQITLSSAVFEYFMDEKVALITCSKNYMPNGMFLPFEGNSQQTKVMLAQIDATVPLKKQLWQQTVKQKIHNQAKILDQLGLPSQRLHHLKEQVLSGDTSNCEGQAASYYWNQIYGVEFIRSQEKSSPNAQLNYGYAILRSVVARALTSSGLHPSIGIFHKNKYNAFCLADDIMEPYRPIVDRLVIDLLAHGEKTEELSKEQKIELLKIPTIDVSVGGTTRPLFHAVSTTTAGLNKCFQGESRKIPYPELD